MLEVSRYPQKDAWEDLMERPVMDLSEIEERVKPIMEKVKLEGDSAIKEFSEKFDKVSLENFKVSKEEIEATKKEVSRELRNAILHAKTNIEKFHVLQKELVKKVEILEGVTCWRKSVPIQKVGLYIPGGTAPLFSTVLMLAVPAALAACPEIVLCTPPNKQGKVHPAILFAASEAGVTDIFKVGGAQAVAAMTYGTESIPATYKLFGPGNQYVTAAKQLAQREGVAIDMPAGPSEVLVMADETANPTFIAADLLSQAEHGEDSQVILVSTNSHLIDQVNEAVQKQIAILPRKEIAMKALQNSRIVLLESSKKAIDFTNEYAPEHLIIAMHKAGQVAEKIVNAGSVFIGNYTPESAGDYASGTNHTLPTNGYARNYSGVSLDSFFKKITFQEITPDGLRRLGPTVEVMAKEELLDAHKMAVTVRLKSLKE